MTAIILAILAPILGGVLIAVFGESPRVRANLLLAGTISSSLAIWSLLPKALEGALFPLVELMPGLSLSFFFDPIAGVMAGLVALLWPLASLYALGYMAGKPKQRWFFVWFSVSMGVTTAIAFSGNLLLLYFFYELLTFVTYPLVVYSGEKAGKAGRTYLVYSLIGAGFFLVATAITWAEVGSLEFGLSPLIQSAFPHSRLVLLLFLLGFGVKTAIMPMHAWLPRAMVAPTPVSALLHAVAVVNAGLFGVLRTLYTIFSPEVAHQLGGQWLWVPAAITVLIASLIAMRQDHLKRRLAYSTISQLSYVLLGASLLSPLGLAAALWQMIAHSLTKIGLFFAVGFISEEAGVTHLSQLPGLGKRYPMVMLAFSLGAVGMVGLLPMPLFWSKWALLEASWDQGFWWYLPLLLTSSLLNALYYLPIPLQAFYSPSPVELEAAATGEEPSPLLLWPTVLLPLLPLLIGLFPSLVNHIFEGLGSLLY